MNWCVALHEGTRNRWKAAPEVYKESPRKHVTSDLKRYCGDQIAH
jgi:hypothetical protein